MTWIPKPDHRTPWFLPGKWNRTRLPPWRIKSTKKRAAPTVAQSRIGRRPSVGSAKERTTQVREMETAADCKEPSRPGSGGTPIFGRQAHQSHHGTASACSVNSRRCCRGIPRVAKRWEDAIRALRKPADGPGLFSTRVSPRVSHIHGVGRDRLLRTCEAGAVA